MAWQDTMVPMVRQLISDFGATQTYADDRIESAIITAGFIVSHDYSFSTDYTFDLVDHDISPDPTHPDTKDNLAVALIVLKAACILTVNSYQTAVAGGISVRDGDTAISTTQGFGGYADIIKTGPCAAYKDLIDRVTIRGAMSKGRAVLSPYGIGNAAWGKIPGYEPRSFFSYFF